MSSRSPIRTAVTALATAATVCATLMFTPAAAAADVQPPSTPGTPVVTNVTTVSVTLTWAPSTGETAVTGYDVFRAPGSASNFAQVGTTAGNSFTDTGLSPGTVYRYQVRAHDAAGNMSALSPFAFAMTAGPCATPPPAPGNLTVLAIGPTSVSLRWGIVVPSYGCSPAGFDVLRAPGASGGTFTPIAQTGFVDTFADTTVSPNSTYRYQVRARSANGLVSGPSNTAQATTPDSCTPPLPLGSLTVIAVGTSSVSLSWAGPTSAACIAYDILRAPGTSGGAFTVVGTTSGLSFTNTGLTLNTSYRYLVQGRNLATGTVWGTSDVVLATTSHGCTLVPPPAPGNLTATSVTATSVGLTWAVTGAPGCSLTYEILRASGTTGGSFNQVGATGGNSFTDTALNPNTTYRYQARTRDAAGNLSPLSNTVTVTTSPTTGGCAATYRVVSAWNGAFQGEVAVTNTGTSPTSGWQVTLTMSGSAAITQLWGARSSQTTSPYTATNETWNGTLAPNATTTFGFNANVAGNTGATAIATCTVA